MTTDIYPSIQILNASSAVMSTNRLAVMLGLVHAGVDATTVTVVFRAANIHVLSPSNAFALILAYDLIAFGSQVFLGAFTNRTNGAVPALRLGLFLTALSTLALYMHPLAALLFAGFGNALFHLGAGTLVLARGLQRSAASGLFVAPGALGLAFGLTYGKLPDLGPVWPLGVVTVLGLILTWRVNGCRTEDVPMRIPGNPSAPSTLSARRLSGLVLGLLLVSVAVRALVGLSATRGLAPSPWWFLGIPLSAFLGKALGGFIADRWGWIETSLCALVASAPVIVFGTSAAPLLLLLGLCLFQMTMPVTLTAVARLMPSRLGTAFGLTCLALVLGALPSMFSGTAPLCVRPMLGVWIILATVAVTLGLKLLGVESHRHFVSRKTLAEGSQ
jgi:FSR family fosmidomycin resistance protein-like MFS transporter